LFYGHLLDGEEYAVKKFYEQKKIANNEIKKFLDKEKTSKIRYHGTSSRKLTPKTKKY
jgi:hypothetical protein